MEQEHDWITSERDSFGRPNTPYDFHTQNMSECKSSLRNLTERSQGMKRKINPKVMNMIDSVEKKELALKNMMRTVIRDKKKIEETILSLDEYKKTALFETWTKVNSDFGQIFAELLPGSFAKLDPPENKTINDGLEVKVSLGKVWKSSLTELSGGQRSLIALSLIMALLQFRPAPMYILDEVDAALDLSHTQNIGRLIRLRFKGSQFVVVSLKDGMFQNANRIFRTRFQEGTSVVQTLTVSVVSLCLSGVRDCGFEKRVLILVCRLRISSEEMIGWIRLGWVSRVYIYGRVPGNGRQSGFGRETARCSMRLILWFIACIQYRRPGCYMYLGFSGCTAGEVPKGKIIAMLGSQALKLMNIRFSVHQLALPHRMRCSCVK